MSVSKVIYNNNTLIDLTPSTAIADDVAEGKKFYLANGNSAIGTSQGGGGGEDYEIEVDSEVSVDESVSTLTYSCIGGCAVLYNNEIHILGGEGNSKNHYKWDGTSWSSVSTLPFSFYYGDAVVYNNEIHILGSYASSSIYRYHYKWDGTKWTSSTSLPFDFYNGAAVVYKNEIHIFGGSGDFTAHYKWSGSSWRSVSTLPYYATGVSAVVYNDEIHILGTGNTSVGNNSHYKWNGSSWTSVSTLPYGNYNFFGCTVVYNNAIHILGGGLYSNTSKYHYRWDGSSWTSLQDLPFNLDNNGCAVVFNNRIHILGGGTQDSKHYALAIEPTSTSTLNITANGIYNLIGTKTESSLNKLVTDLTGEVSCGINVEIDTSGTATADKIASGYTAWVNGEKLTGTMATGGMYVKENVSPSSSSSLTFNNLEIPYANISHYIMFCRLFSTTGVYTIIDGQAYRMYYSSNIIIGTLSGLTVSGSGNSITFTKNSGFNTSITCSLYYC